MLREGSTSFTSLQFALKIAEQSQINTDNRIAQSPTNHRAMDSSFEDSRWCEIHTGEPVSNIFLMVANLSKIFAINI